MITPVMSWTSFYNRFERVESIEYRLSTAGTEFVVELSQWSDLAEWRLVARERETVHVTAAVSVHC